MARKRYISSDISFDRAIGKVLETYGAEPVLLYTWMIPNADDEGKLTGDPYELRNIIWAAWRAKTEEDVARSLQQLAEFHLIIWDQVAHIVYFPFHNFYRYQSYVKPDARRNADPEPVLDFPAKVAENTGNNNFPEKVAEIPTSFSFPVPDPIPDPGDKDPGEQSAKEDPSKLEKIKRSSTPAKKKPETDPRVFQVIKLFNEEHVLRFGVSAKIEKGKDGLLIKRLPKDYTVEMLQRTMRPFFTEDDPWLDKVGRTIGTWAKRVPALVQQIRAAPPPLPFWGEDTSLIDADLARAKEALEHATVPGS